MLEAPLTSMNQSSIAAITRFLASIFSPLILASLLALPAGAADSATVTFTMDFPNSSPEHYSITVDKSGHARYESVVKISDESDDRQTYQIDFDLLDATRARIFDLAAQAHYFSGRVDSGNKKLAFMGSKKLSYRDAQRNTSADYNFSPVLAVEQLTTMFQGLSATLEFGRRLAYFHRFQKLALDDELSHMEEQARRGEIIELQAVKPILQRIYDDETVMNIDRARALRLIEMGFSPASNK